ncbi:SDR family NAD(P)-dependent oxidoreductase [Corallococcus sp. AB011P]|uniref:SDR family NAD(P)-dependent oxidoreductase n=1 Tax=Corallococcus sp. AB011P TaxID=2316735 RepID=UPI000EA22FF5|nr:SDR family NAD(P)-dependent oxidoreductase [Corallococcus sp. AB011P]RKG58299.1 SDR family NAD(P)-dependent oxidoreductase [Corallococcus sp. AB011P]
MSEALPFGARSTAEDVLEGVDLKGRTFLLTGCNAGLGAETLRVLTAHGGHVIGLARSLEQAREACDRVGGSTTPVACDLGNVASVLAAVETVRALGRPLDAIIANAGVMAPPKLELRYGVEQQFFVNHLAHFLLVNRLADRVPDRTGRVVVLSSSAGVNQAPREGIQFDNLDGHRGYKPVAFYGQSKLANALFARELSRRLADRGICVNSLHPGAVRTSLTRSVGFPFTLILPVARLFMRSVEEGAATQTLLAASPRVDGLTGKYWVDCQEARGHRLLEDAAFAQRLWTVSEDLLRPLC